MLSVLWRKLQTAWTVLRSRGLRGLFVVSCDVTRRAADYLVGWRLRRRHALLTPHGVAIAVALPHLSPVEVGLYARLGDRYERNELEMALQHVPLDRPVLELGAGLGVVSCALNRRLADPTAHLAVEALPYLAEALEATKRRNGCAFRVCHAAVAHGAAQIEISRGDNFMGSRTRFPEGGDRWRVPARTIGQLLDEAGFERAVLVCDVEGAEHECFAGEPDTFRTRLEYLILELHDLDDPQQRIEPALRTLDSLGYELIECRAQVYALRNRVLPAQSGSRRR